VVNRLKRLGKPVELLEGTDWDVFVGKGPGANQDERNALIRRAGFFARAITRAGGFAVVAHISPYRELREQLRREIGRFLEVFVDCPMETLLARDTRGEYQKAMRGEIKNFIGVTDPYEPPTTPEVRYDSSKLTVDQGASLVIEALVREGVLQPSDAGLARAPRKPEKKKGGKKPEVPPSILFTPEMLALPRSFTLRAAQPPPAKVEQKPGSLPAKNAGLPTKGGAKVEAKLEVKGRLPGKVESKAPAKGPAKVEPKAAAKAPAKAPAKVEAKAPAKVEAKPAKAPAKPAKVEAKAPAKAAKPEAKGAKKAPPAPVKAAAPSKIAAKTARVPAKPAKKK
jgi:adenylylsulfate kinase-like enzyme